MAGMDDPGSGDPNARGRDQAAVAALAHWQMGEQQQAERLCREILAADPAHPGALHLLGIAAHARGKLDQAVELLRQACRDPRAPGLYHSNLCEMLRQKGGHHPEAEAAGLRAVALAPGTAQAWSNLGIVLQEADKLEESLAALQRAVTLNPNFAEAHSNLGNTLKKLGRVVEARGFYLTALKLKPDYAEGHSNLSATLNQLGERQAALEEARRAMTLDPLLADSYLNAAAAEGGGGNYTAALAWLDRLVGMAPHHVGGLSARALSLSHLDREAEAIVAARLAVAAGADDSDAWIALGQILQRAGRTEEALAAFERATTLKPTGPATSHKAGVLLELGRGEEARALLERELARDPSRAAAWLSYADTRKFAADDPDIARMQAQLAAPTLQAGEPRMHLEFALGKALLDAGDGPAAFAHLGLANAAKRAAIDYDGPATLRWLEKVAAAFPPELFTNVGGAASDRPVFVIGMPRSGTTLVEQILASHPAVHGAGELSDMRLLCHQVAVAGGGVVPYPDYVPRLLPEHCTKLGQAYLARTAAPEAARLVNKMPANFVYAGLIALMLPGAKIIHVIRDPVDTCLSCYTKLFAGEQGFAYDLAELGQFHRGYQGLMAHWRRVLPPGRMLEVEYETLVADQETQSRRMIAHLGLPWDEACLRFHETRRTVRTASVNQVRQPMYKSSVGRWKAYEAELAPLLKALGPLES